MLQMEILNWNIPGTFNIIYNGVTFANCKAKVSSYWKSWCGKSNVCTYPAYDLRSTADGYLAPGAPQAT